MTRRTATGRPSLVLTVVLALLASLLAAPSSADDHMVDVVIRTEPGVPITRTVEQAGGSVTGEFTAIGTVTANVPADTISGLERSPGIASITQNFSITLADTRDGDERDSNETDKWVETATGYINPTTLSEVASTVRADRAHSYGYQGGGVTVALIDSGVTQVSGLTNNILQGPDLSFDSQIRGMSNLDAYGHGTHMAGIIGAMAPKASILNVKVGAADGSVDVSQVLAAINWVIEHKDDNGMNVRVLNLSFGTDTAQAYTLDPLAHAVEVAWRNGIVVVVASGNDENAAPLRSPATDPMIIAVGAADTKGTLDPRDDSIADFSNCGRRRTVDLVAPGRSIASLRVPGSQADILYPEAREGENYFRGSGTSQAAAVVSGVAALVVAAHPDYTPDQVKAALVNTARNVSSPSAACKGSGLVNAKALLFDADPHLSTQTFPLRPVWGH